MDETPLFQAFGIGVLVGLPSAAAVAATARYAVLDAHGNVSLASMGVGAAMASAGLPMALRSLRWSGVIKRASAALLWAGCAAWTGSATLNATNHPGVATLVTALAALGPSLTASACNAVMQPYNDQIASEDRQLRALRLAEAGRRLDALDRGELHAQPATPDRNAEAGVTAWAAAHVSPDVNGRISVKEAYAAQYVWASLNGYATCPTDSTFGQFFRDWARTNGGEKIKSSGVIHYTGLTMNITETSTPLLGGPEHD